MRRIFTFVVVLVLSLSVLSFAKSDKKAKGNGGVEDQIEQLEKQRAEAVVKGDTAALDKMTADDYVLTDVNGKTRTKAEMLDAIKNGGIKLSDNKIEDVKVHVYGNTAVVTGRSTPTGSIDGQDLNGTVRFTRVYVKRDGRWQSVAFQQTKIASQ